MAKLLLCFLGRVLRLLFANVSFSADRPSSWMLGHKEDNADIHRADNLLLVTWDNCWCGVEKWWRNCVSFLLSVVFFILLHDLLALQSCSALSHQRKSRGNMLYSFLVFFMFSLSDGSSSVWIFKTVWWWWQTRCHASLHWSCCVNCKFCLST